MASYIWIRLEKRVQNFNELMYGDEAKNVLSESNLLDMKSNSILYEGSYHSGGDWKDAVFIICKRSGKTILYRCTFRKETLNSTTVLHREVSLFHMNELSCCSMEDYRNAVGAVERVWWLYTKNGSSIQCYKEPTMGMRLSCMQDEQEITRFINDNLINC